MKMTGDIALLHKFRSLPVKMQKKHGRRAMTKGGRRVIAATKPHVPVKYGALEESIGQVVRTYGTATVVSVVGARAGAKFDMVTEDGQVHKPSKIAHLVEMGHGGPHAAGPHPFLRPGYDESKTATQAVIATEMAVGVEQEGI